MADMTERLALRRFRQTDGPYLHALDGDPAVMRYLDRRIRDRTEVESQVLTRLLRLQERWPRAAYWAAETPANGAFVGWFGLHPVVPSEQPIVSWPDAEDLRVLALGYRLRRSAWGQGYATEGSRALVEHAFAELGADEVVATTMTVNTGSRRVLEKAGLRYVRTEHLDWPDPLPGNEHGDVEYRLTRADHLGQPGDAARRRSQ